MTSSPARPADSPRNFHRRRRSGPGRFRKSPEGPRRLGARPRGMLLGVKDSPAHPPGQPGPAGLGIPPTPAGAGTSPLRLSSHLVRVQFHSTAHERHVPLRGGRTPTVNSEPTPVSALGSAERGRRRNRAAPRDWTELSPPPAPRHPPRTQSPSGCRANAPPPRPTAPPPHAAPQRAANRAPRGGVVS